MDPQNSKTNVFTSPTQFTLVAAALALGAVVSPRWFGGSRFAPPLTLLLGGFLILSTSTADAFEKLEPRTNLQAVYFLPVPSSDLVNAQLIISAGEADASGPDGIAHFVEHLALDQSVGDLTASPAHHLSDGYTRSDVTTYVAAGRPAKLGTILNQLAKVLRTPKQSGDQVDRVRNVVLREYDLRVVESVGRRLYERLGKILYEGHSLGRRVLGTPQRIAQLTLEKAQTFHRRVYTASNATLVIVGNVQRSDVVKLVEQSFGSYPALQRTRRGWRDGGRWAEARHVVSERDEAATRPLVMMRELFDVRGFEQRELALALPLLQGFLKSGLPGGLENNLVHDNYLVSEFGLSLRLVTHDSAEAVFWAVPAENMEWRRVIDVYRSALSQLVEAGIPEATIKRLRTYAQRHVERQKSDVVALAQHAAHWIMHDLAPPELAVESKQISNLSTATLNRLLAALTYARRSVVGHVSPIVEGVN